MSFNKDLWEFLKKIKWEDIKQIYLNPRLIDDQRKEIESLKKELKDSKLLFFEDDLCWRSGENGNKEGPFCPSCWDSNRKMIRMISIQKGGRINSGWRCTVCSYNKVEYDNSPLQIPNLRRL